MVPILRQQAERRANNNVLFTGSPPSTSFPVPEPPAYALLSGLWRPSQWYRRSAAARALEHQIQARPFQKRWPPGTVFLFLAWLATEISRKKLSAKFGAGPSLIFLNRFFYQFLMYYF